MSALIFSNPDLRTLRQQLFEASPNEAAAVLLAGRMLSGATTRLLIREVHPIPQHSYRVQEKLSAIVDPSFFVPLLKRARREGWSIVLAHTHPFAEQANFSSIDDQGERTLMPALFARADARPHGALVLTQSDCAARLWHPHETASVDCERIAEVGREVITHGLRHYKEDDDVPEEFDRSVRALGREGQASIAALTIAIVGLGGLGSIVAEQLAHLGVSQFLLIDPDEIEATNLNRVVGATKGDIRRPKVSVAREMVGRISSQSLVTPMHDDVTSSPIARQLLSADFVFCCTDSHGSRAVINQLAYQFLIPTIDMGVRVQTREGRVESVTGRIQMLAPGLPCLVCQNLLDSEEVRRDLLTEEQRARDPYIVGVTEPQPAVISLNGTVASLGVTMMISAVAGLPVISRHQLVLFDRGVTRSVSSAPDPNCVICSLRGCLARGDIWPMPGRPD